jgi:predicted nucleic acid-binding protein
VLTRLPAPHRARGEVIREFLRARFPQPFVRLSAGNYRRFLSALPDRAVSGDAADDALVAATAADHDAELVSCDRRAAVIYELYRVRINEASESARRGSGPRSR